MSGTFLRAPGPDSAGLRIGLLGGSFNPAHQGHLYVSRVALKQLGLDYVWWLVSPQNPLKPSAGMAPMAIRAAQARKVAAHPRIRVTTIEAGLGTRFTVDTVAALRRRFPHLDFAWLMGSDNLEQFRRWRRWPDIAAQVPIAVIARPGTVLASLCSVAVQRFGRLPAGSGLWDREPPAIAIIDGPRDPSSSTAIREFGAPDAV